MAPSSLPTNHFEPLTPEQRQTLYTHHRDEWKLWRHRWRGKTQGAAIARIEEIVRLRDDERIALTPDEASLLGFKRADYP